MRTLYIFLLLAYCSSLLGRDITVVYTDNSCIECFKILKRNLDKHKIRIAKVVYNDSKDFWKNKYTETSICNVFGKRIKIEKVEMTDLKRSPYIISVGLNSRARDTLILNYSDLFDGENLKEMKTLFQYLK